MTVMCSITFDKYDVANKKDNPEIFMDYAILFNNVYLCRGGEVQGVINYLVRKEKNDIILFCLFCMFVYSCSRRRRTWYEDRHWSRSCRWLCWRCHPHHYLHSLQIMQEIQR